MHTIRIAAAGLTILALSACGGTKPATQPSSPAGQEQTTAAPASKAPASSAAPKAPTSTPEQLVLSGSTAGLDFKPTSAEDKQKMSQMASMYNGMKIEPAECKQVVQNGLQATDPNDGISMAMPGETGYVAGVSRKPWNAKQTKELAAKCGNLKIEMAGMTATGSSKVEEQKAEGATDVLFMTNTTEVAGRKSTMYTKSGSVRGLTVMTASVGGEADKAKIDEIFKTQVDKVVKAS